MPPQKGSQHKEKQMEDGFEALPLVFSSSQGNEGI